MHVYIFFSFCVYRLKEDDNILFQHALNSKIQDNEMKVKNN